MAIGAEASAQVLSETRDSLASWASVGRIPVWAAGDGIPYDLSAGLDNQPIAGSLSVQT